MKQVSYDIINPFTLTVVEKVNYTNMDECSLAIKNLNLGLKIKQDINQKCQILTKLGKLLEENENVIAKLLAEEMGKSIKDGRIEVRRSLSGVDCAIHELKALRGEVLYSDSYLPPGMPAQNKMAIVNRFPIGVVLAITPFNFPINLAIHKIIPAFAMGNTILFKPHPQCYRSSKKLVELCHAAGFDKNQIVLIVPDVPELQQVIANDNIQCISFTGGYKTAKAISEKAGVKKQLYELGGNDALIVYPDANLEYAVKKTIEQRFLCSGQRCTASKRIFVHQDVLEKFTTQLKTETEKLKIGDPSLESTDVGPVVHSQSADQVWSRIQSAIADGAKVIFGNKRENNVIHPTILTNVKMTSELVADETFGPVAPIFSFKTDDEVLAMVNASTYGLQCGVFTNNLEKIKFFYQHVEVGCVVANEGPAYRIDHFPFGGMKHSGLGREGIPYTMQEMSVLKSMVI